MIINKPNSLKSSRNRYTQGGTTDSFNDRLGWWERTIFPVAPDDINYTIESGDSGRADIIAFKLYGKANLAWLILQFNNIVDPATELVTGKIISIPTPARVSLTITTA